MPNFDLDQTGILLWLMVLCLAAAALAGSTLCLSFSSLGRHSRVKFGLFAICGLAGSTLLLDLLVVAQDRLAGIELSLARLAMIVLSMVGFALIVPRGSPESFRRLPVAGLALGLALLGWICFRMDQPSANDIDLYGCLESKVPHNRLIAAPLVAWTDQGTIVHLQQLDDPTLPPVDEDIEHIRQYRGQIIQTAPADSRYTCHGWTFTGGLYHVPGRAVDMILAENNYQKVSKPREGDIIVYRDMHGGVIHTGVVRAAGSDGFVLIESKWGYAGRYLHAPEVQSYSNHYEYFRSPRLGHLLTGLDPGSMDESNGCFAEPEKGTFEGLAE